MSKKFLSLSLALLLFGSAGLVPARAAVREAPQAGAGDGQQERDAKSAAKFKERVAGIGTGPRARVEVKLRDGSKVKGHITEIGEDDFTVLDKSKGATTVAYSETKSINSRYLPYWMKVTAWVTAGILAPIFVAALVEVAKGGQ